MATAGRVDPAAAHALRERRALPPGELSRARRPLGPPAPEPLADRAECLRPLPPHGRGVPRARRGGAPPVAVGRGGRRAPDRADPRRGRRLRARRRGRLPPRPRRDRAPRAELPRRARRRPTRRARLRAARVRRRRRRGRRRDGGGDRVAERARCGRQGDVGAPARTRAVAAQRPPCPVLAPWARRLPRLLSLRARRAARRPPATLLPGRTPLGRPDRACRCAVPRRGGGERRGAGDLRDGIPARLRARPAARAPGRRPRPRDARPLDRAGAGLDRPGPDRHERGRSRWPGSPGSGPTLRSDTLVGAKYAARGFLRRVAACRTR